MLIGYPWDVKPKEKLDAGALVKQVGYPHERCRETWALLQLYGENVGRFSGLSKTWEGWRRLIDAERSTGRGGQWCEALVALCRRLPQPRWECAAPCRHERKQPVQIYLRDLPRLARQCCPGDTNMTPEVLTTGHEPNGPPQQQQSRTCSRHRRLRTQRSK